VFKRDKPRDDFAIQTGTLPARPNDSDRVIKYSGMIVRTLRVEGGRARMVFTASAIVALTALWT